MDSICIICTAKFQQNEDFLSLVCGHVFHQKCLDEWIAKSNNCPKCRRDNASSFAKPIFLDFQQSERTVPDKEVAALQQSFETVKSELENSKLQVTMYNEQYTRCKRDWKHIEKHLNDEIQRLNEYIIQCTNPKPCMYPPSVNMQPQMQAQMQSQMQAQMQTQMQSPPMQGPMPSSSSIVNYGNNFNGGTESNERNPCKIPKQCNPNQNQNPNQMNPYGYL